MANNEYGCGTDVGNVRDHNEDSYSINPEKGLYLVSDGMGGHLGGDVASEIVISSVSNDIVNNVALTDALSRAHHAVKEAAQTGRGVLGMGATVVALMLDRTEYEIAWVGDSRAYLWDGRSIRQLTCDHSYVQKLLDSGAITEAEAKDHPQRSIISQALGAKDIAEVEVDRVSGKLYQGEKILLCSDGLTSELEDEAIAGILSSGGTDQEIVDRLIIAAKNHGGEDNITAILVSALKDAPARQRKGGTAPMKKISSQDKPGKDRKNNNLFFLILLIVVICFAILAIGFFGVSSKTTSSDPLQVSVSGKKQTYPNLPCPKPIKKSFKYPISF